MCFCSYQVVLTWLALQLRYNCCYFSSLPMVIPCRLLVLEGSPISDHGTFINPRRACAARVTVLGLCVCLCVCVSVTQHLTFYVCIHATNDTNLLGGGRRSKILSDFL